MIIFSQRFFCVPLVTFLLLPNEVLHLTSEITLWVFSRLAMQLGVCWVSHLTYVSFCHWPFFNYRPTWDFSFDLWTYIWGFPAHTTILSVTSRSFNYQLRTVFGKCLCLPTLAIQKHSNNKCWVGVGKLFKQAVFQQPFRSR